MMNNVSNQNQQNPVMNGNNFNPQMSLPPMGMNMEQMALNMLQQAAPNNPFLANILNMAQNNNINGIEQAVRNFLEQCGANYDQLFPQFLNQIGNMPQIPGMFGGMK